MASFDVEKNTLYLIYDKECPMCRNAAQALNIKKAVGKLELINARQSHPLVTLIYEKGLNPDQGIIVIYNGCYYYAAEAIQLLALLNSPIGLFNKTSALLLRSKITAKFLYP